VIQEKWLRVRLKLQWVPGHKEIEGNEKVNKEAKHVTEGEHWNHRNEHHCLLKTLPASKLVTKQHLKNKIQKEYEKEFHKSLRYERAVGINPKIPTSNFMKIAAKLLWNWTGIDHLLPTLLHNLHCAKETVTVITGQGQEYQVGDISRWKDDETPHGTHLWHKMIQGLTQQPTIHGTGWRRTLMIPDWPPFLYFTFPLSSFLFFFPAFFIFSLFPFSLLHLTVPYPTLFYPTLSHRIIHCVHVAPEPPQEAMTVGVRLKHRHYSYTWALVIRCHST